MIHTTNHSWAVSSPKYHIVPWNLFTEVCMKNNPLSRKNMINTLHTAVLKQWMTCIQQIFIAGQNDLSVFLQSPCLERIHFTSHHMTSQCITWPHKALRDVMIVLYPHSTGLRCVPDPSRSENRDQSGINVNWTAVIGKWAEVSGNGTALSVWFKISKSRHVYFTHTMD